MSNPDDSVIAVVQRLAGVLEAAGAVYAFGGALALAAWSEPRATADVDVVLWVEPEAIGTAIDWIRSAGVVVDESQARIEATERGMFVGRAGLVRVDVFVPSIPFYEQAALLRVRSTIGSQPVWVHSAEVLAVFKMLFFRSKDLVDLERMLQVRGAEFDRAFVRDALSDMLGEDERIEEWDVLCQRVSVESS